MLEARRPPFRSILVLACALVTIVTAVPARAERPRPAGPVTPTALEAAWERHRALEASSIFHGLEWRSIGPVRQGGRVVDIEPISGNPYGFYVAYASGGLWKTTNNGGTFEPLFDDQPTMIIGDVAVDPNDSAVVWVGTGENNSSRSSYGGMGMFRSADGGATWEHRGLADTDRIGRVVIDPRDGDRLWVAALGKLYTPGGGRGVYETRDGGRSWSRVLAGDDWTGFIDLVRDPSAPDTLYAAAWERQRRPWNFVEGGDGSGIYKTTDGGASWTRLGGGFPRGEHVGRIGLAVAPSQPRTIYAALDNQEPLPEAEWDLGDAPLSSNRLRTMTREEFLVQDPEAIEDFIRGSDLDTELDAEALVEMVDSGELTMDELRGELEDANASLFDTNVRGLELWRSDDGGATWRRTHDEPIRDVVYTYGYYFGQLAVAPDDPERVYLEGVPLIVTTDGGASFESLQRPGVHVDYHPIWADPANPSRLLVGNDGGIDASYDRGDTWFSLDAQPVGQFYAITVDDADPYNVYGGLQDNGTLKGSSETRWQEGDRWQVIGGGDGMYVQVDPRNDQTTYTGFQFGFYRRSGPDGRGTVRPRDALRAPAYRYNWMTPILLSSHNPDIVYFGTQKLLRSMDRGETWTEISDDLTVSTERGDVPFATISTIAESELAFGLLWVGTDDGQVWVTADGGVSWRAASDGLPGDRWVSRVEASRVVRERAYLSLTGYRDDDVTPYLYVTEDLGRTWRSIADGLPAEAVNVVREDPTEPDVLYVGTDRGVYVSLDRGAAWHALQAGLPNVPVHDLVVQKRRRELVAGTHGRSIWIVDVLPVQELAAAEAEPALALYPLEDVTYERGWRNRPSPWFDRGTDDPQVRVPYFAASAGNAELTVLDGEDRPLVTLRQEAQRGVNTFVWDLTFDETLALEAERAANAPADDERKGKKSKKREKAEADEPESEDTMHGAAAKTPWAEAVRLGWPLRATPGTYTLRVTVGEETADTELVVDKPEKREPRRAKEKPIRGRDE